MPLAACSDVYNVLEEDEEGEEEENPTSGAVTPVTPKILMSSASRDEPDFPTPVHSGTIHSSKSPDQPRGVNSPEAPGSDNVSVLSQTSTIVEETEDLQTSTNSEKT